MLKETHTTRISKTGHIYGNVQNEQLSILPFHLRQSLVDADNSVISTENIFINKKLPALSSLEKLDELKVIHSDLEESNKGLISAKQKRNRINSNFNTVHSTKKIVLPSKHPSKDVIDRKPMKLSNIYQLSLYADKFSKDDLNPKDENTSPQVRKIRSSGKIDIGYLPLLQYFQNNLLRPSNKDYKVFVPNYQSENILQYETDPKFRYSGTELLNMENTVTEGKGKFGINVNDYDLTNDDLKPCVEEDDYYPSKSVIPEEYKQRARGHPVFSKLGAHNPSGKNGQHQGDVIKDTNPYDKSSTTQELPTKLFYQFKCKFDYIFSVILLMYYSSSP